MPRLWNDTIETHKQIVRDAALDAAASLVMRRGLSAVTMSEIAERTGIGRATLYKYFPDVQTLLHAWHERQIGRHLAALGSIAQGGEPPLERLGMVLGAYADMAHGQHDGDLASLLHSGGHAAHARKHLTSFVSELIAEGVAAGAVRTDMPPQELAIFCLAAMSGARDSQSDEAIHRLVALTIDALGPRTDRRQKMRKGS